VITSNDLYGGSYRMFKRVYEKIGIKFHFLDLTNSANIPPYVNKNTRLLWLETPSNPLMGITDIGVCVEIAKKQNILVAVDNTFASPYLQNPLDMGVDIVMHSVTKYLGGHSDVIMGALVVNEEKLQQELAFIANACGSVPGPQDSFLVLRGIKTLHLRMERHCSNGKTIAGYLRNHPKVGKVYWPGFADHPNHVIAKKQMKDFGGMLSFTLKNDGLESATKLMETVKLFSLAESLGGVESLINHPASMTHASIPREERIKNGLSDSLIRLSIGVEDAEDLIADLEQALSGV
jgi:cystathionine beta-lyase